MKRPVQIARSQLFPEVRIINDLKQTDEYRELCRAETLGSPSRASTYLENRLLRALLAGVEIGKRCEAEARANGAEGTVPLNPDDVWVPRL